MKQKDEQMKQVREEVRNSPGVSSFPPPASPISSSSSPMMSSRGDGRNSDFMLQQVLQSFAQLQNRMDISEKFNLIRRDLDMIRHDIDSSRSIGGNKSSIGTSAIDKSVIDTSLIGKSLIGKSLIGNNSSSDEVSSKVVVPSRNVSTQTAAVSIRSVCTQTLERSVVGTWCVEVGDESKKHRMSQSQT